MFETVLAGGTILDGTRAPRRIADVGVNADRIVAIGDLSTADCGSRLDVSGLCVAPGFVDVHNHSDGWMLKEPLQSSKIMQGFTTEVTLLDGISYAPVSEQTWREWFFYLRALDGLRLDEYQGWTSIAEFMDAMDGRCTQNAIPHVPYANVRAEVCGFGPKPPSTQQMGQIADLIRQGMDQGAVGLSSGLDYIVQCHSSADELTEACRVVAEYGGLYATHIRYKLGLFKALDEALDICRRSGAALHVSHLKCIVGTVAEDIIDWLENARKEVPLSFDVYPYLPGSTMLNYLLPYEVWDEGPLAAMTRIQRPEIQAKFAANLKNYKLALDSIRIAWLPGRENEGAQGMLLSEYVSSTGLPAEKALLNLLIEERMAVLCVYLEGDDDLISPFLEHDLYMMGSDGIYAEGGMIHPRQFGSAARLLGRFVRKKQRLTLEDAAYKLSGHAAEKFGLKDRGVLEEGRFADIVVFDADRVNDAASWDEPCVPAEGFEHVLVNGRFVVRDATVVESWPDGMPGRRLYFNR